MTTETQYPALFGASAMPGAQPKKKKPSKRGAKPDLADRLKAAKPKGCC